METLEQFRNIVLKEMIKNGHSIQKTIMNTFAMLLKKFFSLNLKSTIQLKIVFASLFLTKTFKSRRNFTVKTIL
jgi:hypothetical protein